MKQEAQSDLFQKCDSGPQQPIPKLQPSAFSLQPLRGAFTVIELVGVLAIIAIIAAALAPNIIKRIDRAAWNREVADLNTMANGLVQTVLKDKVITNQANLAAVTAKYLDLAVNQVAKTPRLFDRYFITDPNFRINGNILPYGQGPNGALVGPVTNRVMIISTIAPALPTQLSSPLTAAIFDAIWKTPDTAVPAWFSQPPQNWKGKSDDLCIRRVDLGSLFHKVLLQNTDTNTSHFAYYRLDSDQQPPPLSPNGSNITFYVLDGTALGLYQLSDSANLQFRVIIRQDESFTYQNNRWSQNLDRDQPNFTLVDPQFGYWVSRFLSANDSCRLSIIRDGATQRAVVDEFYNFLWAYWSWAQPTPAYPNGFPRDTSGNNARPLNPYFRTVDDAQGRVDAYSSTLIGKSPSQ